jgi:hypothetical protein
MLQQECRPVLTKNMSMGARLWSPNEEAIKEQGRQGEVSLMWGYRG